ncbi:hypothetical protein F0562_023559 [Nyssa sinensis]|uniref:Uncharacterized protein n=1 Tax=Nyssa sinensis TaxID=561372 RepID=A0A5J5BGQ0_9ASTE|nr:hypothetical protein F0562_023559 [Nyssa sinensis]
MTVITIAMNKDICSCTSRRNGGEHYDASGQAQKWAHKWCSIHPQTQLEAGHAHVWHERWGEYDGRGGSMKYTDKWAERSEGDGWTKWGDKWDENFDPNSHGVKQAETWWEGKHGERWNRTWGEQHNGSGWVHKYGKSSSGEHWTPMWSKKHGMRDTLTTIFSIALTTQRSSSVGASKLQRASSRCLLLIWGLNQTNDGFPYSQKSGSGRGGQFSWGFRSLIRRKQVDSIHAKSSGAVVNWPRSYLLPISLPSIFAS